MKTRLNDLLTFLAHGLRQSDLDYLDKGALALAAQFRHWAIACDEAAKRPTRRAMAIDTSTARNADADTSTAFSLTPRMPA